MGFGFSTILISVLTAVVLLGIGALRWHVFFGILIPYAAVSLFIAGFVYRVVKWARAPVPFRIPVTGGQQKSLPWIEASRFDNPSDTPGVIGRMALEVIFFRSLFRNTKMELREGPKLVYRWEKWLWLGGLLFHWSLLILILRHLRFFAEPVPVLVDVVEGIDGFLRIGLQAFFITDALILLAAAYLLIRRIVIPHLKYISLPSDYFPLVLITAIILSGIMMRYFWRVDVVAVKELTMSLVTFNPRIPEGIGALFYIHLFLVSVLFAYFPFSKLMHMGGIFLSPTRNLPNDSRAKRHLNPWNYPVQVHTYEQYEDEFRGKMVEAGLPVEKG